MLRAIALITAIACLSVAGCRRAEPQATVAPAEKQSAAEAPSTTSLPPTPTTSVERPSQTTPSAAPTAPSSSPLRSLAAQLVESDGMGGWRINEKSATEFEKLGPESVKQLWALLQDPQVEVRRGAAFYLLGQLDSNDQEHVPAFTALLEDRDRTIRNIGLSAVKQFSKLHQIAAVPRLITLLDPAHEDKPDNRAAVARICGALRNDAAGALPALSAAAARDPDAKVRAAALAAIGQIAEPEAGFVSLRGGLADAEASVRLVATARLRQYGKAAAPAAKELAGLLSDADTSVAENAAECLIRIGDTAVEPLAAQLSSKSAASRKLALACLAKVGPAARSAAAAIEKCKSDPDPQVRQLADAALARIGAKK